MRAIVIVTYISLWQGRSSLWGLSVAGAVWVSEVEDTGISTVAPMVDLTLFVPTYPGYLKVPCIPRIPRLRPVRRVFHGKLLLIHLIYPATDYLMVLPIAYYTTSLYVYFI